MSQQVDMNAFLYSLLITKQMNDFTVSEAKDALLREHAEFTDDKKTRMFVYRQLSRNIEKGLIKRTDFFDGDTKKVLYSKTEAFGESMIIPIKRTSKAKKMNNRKAPPKKVETINYKIELKKELAAYEIDLNTALEEANEYNRLATRFPELQAKLKHHQSEAKVKSIKLLGKVHALQNLLGYTVTGHQSC
jgi:hypothetical protein